MFWIRKFVWRQLKLPNALVQVTKVFSIIRLKCVLYRITVARYFVHNIAIDLNMPFDGEWGTNHADFKDGNEMAEWCEPRHERANAQRDSVQQRLGNEKRQLRDRSL